MKLLWVYSDFLHPTNRGGQIRTLETLKCLHRRHEVHYAGLWNPNFPEGPARAKEYASYVYPVRRTVTEKTSPAFLLQLAKGLVTDMPVAVFRHRNEEMRATVDRLLREHSFDHVVCDFLSSAPHFSDLSGAVLFQHNVEAMIWNRHVEHAGSPWRRSYFRRQARLMLEYERQVCQSVKNVIAVSEADAARMRELYGVQRVAAVPTGVDVAYFQPAAEAQPATDLVFVGSMDWMPNIDGAVWFVNEVLPLIRRKMPDCSLAVVGRTPGREVTELAERDPGIRITGTVADVRPWLWESKVSIVPLRIGGGTRLKIYEAMAARTPVVSTTVGAEGLDISPGENILIADEPGAFAEACVRLLGDANERRRIADAAGQHVETKHSWEAAAVEFERALESEARESQG
jgi:sugar transferase (PEP-CTERM/EpsH1 system associated)